MHESTVREFADLSEATVDSSNESPVIRGAVLLGSVSKNAGTNYKRRVYLPAAMKAAVPLYEGARGYYNHGDPDKASRDVRDFAGVWRNVTFDANESKLRGDFHIVNDSAGKRLAWIAQEFPTNSFGFSHDAAIVGDVDIASESLNISQIRAVRSVDVVDRPATTSNFFEGVTNTVPPITTQEDQDVDTIKATEDRVKAEADRDAAIAKEASTRKELDELKAVREVDSKKASLAETQVFVEAAVGKLPDFVSSRVRAVFEGKIATEDDVAKVVTDLEAFASEAREDVEPPAPGARRIDDETKTREHVGLDEGLSESVFGAMCGVTFEDEKTNTK